MTVLLGPAPPTPPPDPDREELLRLRRFYDEIAADWAAGGFITRADVKAALDRAKPVGSE